MGATVTCGKHAAAFQTNGRTIYVLFEKTYEKNCHPHNPSWHAVAYGSYETVMKWVFLAASSCEGGMLQNTRGHIRPEKYLIDWITLIRKPIQMLNCHIDLYVGQPGYWLVPIESDSGDKWTRDIQKTPVLGRLRAAGMTHVADQLEAGEHIKGRLFDLVDLLHVVYPEGRSIWRVLPESAMPSGPGLKQLGPELRIGTAPTEDWAVWKLAQEDHLLIKSDGSSLIEWPYSIVGSFINDVACPMEMQRTGSAIEAITRCREMVKSAPAIPGDTRVTIRRNPERDRWHLESVDNLAKVLGLADAEGRAPDAFEVVLQDVLRSDQNALWCLKGVHARDREWVIPLPSKPAATTFFQQLDLLAA